MKLMGNNYPIVEFKPENFGQIYSLFHILEYISTVFATCDKDGDKYYFRLKVLEDYRGVVEVASLILDELPRAKDEVVLQTFDKDIWGTWNLEDPTTYTVDYIRDICLSGKVVQDSENRYLMGGAFFFENQIVNYSIGTEMIDPDGSLTRSFLDNFDDMEIPEQTIIPEV